MVVLWRSVISVAARTIVVIVVVWKRHVSVWVTVIPCTSIATIKSVSTIAVIAASPPAPLVSESLKAVAGTISEVEVVTVKIELNAAAIAVVDEVSD